MNSFLQTFNDISLRTNSDTEQLELRNIENSGTDYYCALFVKSHGFSATGRFHFVEEYLLAFLNDLNEMEASLKGKATLKNYFDENHFKFEMLATGQIFVSGLLSGDGEYPQSLVFCFQSDQTLLKPLLEDFNKFLKFG